MGGGGGNLTYTRRWARALAILRRTVHSLSLLIFPTQFSKTVSTILSNCARSKTAFFISSRCIMLFFFSSFLVMVRKILFPSSHNTIFSPLFLDHGCTLLHPMDHQIDGPLPDLHAGDPAHPPVGLSPSGGG